jgi:hypothetical protein
LTISSKFFAEITLKQSLPVFKSKKERSWFFAEKDECRPIRRHFCALKRQEQPYTQVFLIASAGYGRIWDIDFGGLC